MERVLKGVLQAGNRTLDGAEVGKDEQLTREIAARVNPAVESADEIDEIVWQKDLKVPEGTAFPATVEFEYVDKEAFFYIYHFNGTEWEVAGEGKDGKATVTFDKLSPVALVTMKAAEPEVPDTADASGLHQWSFMAAVCAAGIILICMKRREEE